MGMSRRELQQLADAGQSWAKAALLTLDEAERQVRMSGKHPAVPRSQGKKVDLCGHLAAQLNSVGAPEFRWSGHPDGEYFFHPRRKWRLDFYFPQHRVAIEVEGGVGSHRRKTQTSAAGNEYLVQSRHLTPEGFEADAIKYWEAEVAGISLFRVSGAMVGRDQAISMAIQMLEARGFVFPESKLLTAYRGVVEN